MIDAKAIAARYWFGYGRWSAPYWFVGMEPGGDDDHASYESWLALAGPGRKGLIDCKDHHDDSNVRAAQSITHWHDSVAPPIQQTWGPLIRTALAFESRPHSDTDVASYQRDEWGREGGNTAVVELSAFHARNLGVDVERTLHRSDRIAEIKKQLDAAKPAFALFYGLSYKSEYEKIAGTFGPGGWTWRGSTLCVLVFHPAYRYAPGKDFWVSLGKWIRSAVRAGSHEIIDPCPKPSARTRNRSHEVIASKAPLLLEGTEFPVLSDGVSLGRILYDGWNVRVERKLNDGEFQLMGFYERTRPNQLPRKLGEIHSIFKEWTKLNAKDPKSVKVAWRAKQFVQGFVAPLGAVQSGCAVVEENGVEVARIFKVLPDSAAWVWRSVE